MQGYKTPRACRIKKGLSGEGEKGECFGYIDLDNVWAVVRWMNDNCPSTILASTLELQEITWTDMGTHWREDFIQS